MMHKKVGTNVIQNMIFATGTGLACQVNMLERFHIAHSLHIRRLGYKIYGYAPAFI